MAGYIAVDLDGTLAEYHGWGPIGKPIPLMVNRVKFWLSRGIEVKIFTARAVDPAWVPEIKAWCKQHIGTELEVTNVKDLAMIELYDDRARQVEFNTGRVIGEDI